MANLAPGSHTVRINITEGGFNLNWIKLVCVDSTTEIIVDNTDPGFSVVSGTWGASSWSPQKYGTNYRYHATNNPETCKIRWTPDLDFAGDYEVYLWYNAYSTRPNDAPYPAGELNRSYQRS